MDNPDCSCELTRCSRTCKDLLDGGHGEYVPIPASYRGPPVRVPRGFFTALGLGGVALSNSGALTPPGLNVVLSCLLNANGHAGSADRWQGSDGQGLL